MKITIPSPKLIRELTKYISVSDMKSMNRKLYSSPKIKDAPAGADEFLRASELFDRRSDVASGWYRRYDYEDVDLYEEMCQAAIDKNKFKSVVSKYIETDLPYYVDIIGTNKRYYFEHFGCKNPKYQSKSYYKDGITIDDYVNILYHAHVDCGYDTENVSMSLDLLKQGTPIETVIHYLKESKLKASNGSTISAPGLMEFVMNHPNIKRYMITYNNSKTEVFDNVGAKIFDRLCEMTNGDEKEAYKLLWDCRIESNDGSYHSDFELFQMLEFMYSKLKHIPPAASEILFLIKDKKFKTYYLSKIKRLIQNNSEMDDIMKFVRKKCANSD